MKAQSSQFYKCDAVKLDSQTERSYCVHTDRAGDGGDASAVSSLNKQCSTCMVVINEAHVTLSMTPVIDWGVEAMFH